MVNKAIFGGTLPVHAALFAARLCPNFDRSRNISLWLLMSLNAVITFVTGWGGGPDGARHCNKNEMQWAHRRWANINGATRHTATSRTCAVKHRLHTHTTIIPIKRRRLARHDAESGNFLPLSYGGRTHIIASTGARWATPRQRKHRRRDVTHGCCSRNFYFY